MRLSINSILQRLVPGGPVYVRVRRTMLQIRDVSNGREISIEPILVVSGEDSVKASRLSSAPPLRTEDSTNVRRLNGFDHPRTIIFDFVVAERTLQLALAELFRERTVRPAPVLVIHPLERIEGGLTWIEKRALLELGEGSGARKVYIWEGRTLTDTEIKDPTTFSESSSTSA